MAPTSNFLEVLSVEGEPIVELGAVTEALLEVDDEVDVEGVLGGVMGGILGNVLDEMLEEVLGDTPNVLTEILVDSGASETFLSLTQQEIKSTH